MKFKDKDGNVFAKISSAVDYYCHLHLRGGKCTQRCPLFGKNEEGIARCSTAAIEANPAEAARLMGYAVVEEDKEGTVNT